MDKDEKIAELEGITQYQATLIEAQTQEIEAQAREIAELKRIITDLQEKLNKGNL